MQYPKFAKILNLQVPVDDNFSVSGIFISWNILGTLFVALYTTVYTPT
jgi:hypothetical protein